VLCIYPHITLNISPFYLNLALLALLYAVVFPRIRLKRRRITGLVKRLKNSFKTVYIYSFMCTRFKGILLWNSTRSFMILIDYPNDFMLILLQKINRKARFLETLQYLEIE
jgi:hypothetical protein